MAYRILADMVVVVHGGFVLFVMLGGLLVWHYRSLMWLHLPAVVWGVLIEWAGWMCPLTPLEKELRALGEQAGYSDGFIDHYLLPILYPESLTHLGQITLGVIVLTVNLFVYWRGFSRMR